MKHFRIIPVLIAACTVLLLTACGKSTDNNTDDILLKINEANTKEALKENNDKVGYSLVFSDANGSETAIFTYQDADTYLYDYYYDGIHSLVVDQSGNMTYYYGAEDTYVTGLFVGENAYAEESSQWSVTWYEYDLQEKIIDSKKSNEMLIVETEINDADALAEYAEMYACDVEEIEKVAGHYEVDAQNYEIYKMSFIIHFTDGTTVTNMQVSRVENYVDYMPSDDMMPKTDLGTRTVTLIENPGTPEEKELQFKVPHGYEFDVYFSDEYDDDVYADAAFTTELEVSDDLTQDVIGYIRKAE